MAIKPSGFDRRQARSRLRELSKYYCAISSLKSSDDSLNNQIAEQKPGRHPSVSSNQVQEAFTLATPRLTSDETLTALAQLATLKTQCQRCCISLIDGNAQHIIAEATKSISLFEANDHLQGDELVLGMQSLPLDYGFSPLAVDAFVGPHKLSLTVEGNKATSNYIQISDLTLEPLTRKVSVLQHIPVSIRFYLSVPLRSHTGALLGVLTVSDPEARSSSPRDIQSLQEIAILVVKHLDGIRIREDHRRTERLLDALSYFIKGRGTIDTPPQNPEEPSEYNPRTESPQAESRRPMSTKEALRPKLSSLRSSKVIPSFPTGASHSYNNKTASSLPPRSPSTSASADQNSANGNCTPFEPITRLESQSTSLTSVAVREAFSRASNLIRESMDLDATCFLEVPQNERFKNSTRQRPYPGKSSFGRPGSSAQRSDPMSTEVTATSSESSHSNDEEDERRDSDVLCHRLGFSSRDKSSFASSSATQGFLTVSVRLLTRLALKYPKGHIFHFDEVGSMSSSDESVQIEKNSSKTGVRVKISGELCGHFPTARSLIFLPLYDNERQTQYAGFLGWTSNPVRALQEHEIVYVLGFANSLMCEVMRLETLATDKAKSDFISSISHELRSPLHGILAAGQLLSESRISSSQAEYVEMIDTCARTLLDIMNHLLEHAKINHFTALKNTKSRLKTQEDGAHPKQGPSYSSVTSVDLSSIVEETVESMVASGQRMHGRDESTLGKRTPLSEKSFPAREQSSSPLSTILFIDMHHPLTFNTEAGSWRRIIMNLLGNSLKYTQSGHVTVRLAIKNSEDSKCMAELTVMDTGQGISGEFLKHRLYTPFAQEDNLSVGAGLGLSIVHQIIKSLNGNIRVNSELGVGTEIVVQVPLEQTSSDVDAYPSKGLEDSLSIPALKGKTIKYCGFDVSPETNSASRTKALATMLESLSGLMDSWFGMTRTTSDQADILVMEETWLADNANVWNMNWANIIVVGLSLQAKRVNQIPLANVVYASSTIGPHRMARVLRNVLIDWRSRDHTNTSSELDVSSITGLAISKLETSEPPSALSRSSTTDKSSNVTLLGAATAPSRPSTPSAKPQPSPVPATPKDGLKGVILLVDDNEINLRILANCVKKFKSSSVQFVEALNGKEALDRYIAAIDAGLRVPLIFMDISMPVMDGFTATRLIRSFERSRGIDQSSQAVIVAFTGLASEQAQHDVEKYGFDLYYRKPVNVKTVRELVETTLVRNGRQISESAVSPV